LPRGNPSPFAESNGWARRTGLFGAYLFTAFALPGITPATVGLVLLTLAFLFVFRDWRTLGRDPLAVTAAIFALYVGGHSVVIYLTAPVDVLAEAAAEAGADWIKMLLFIPFAFWAGGQPKRIRLLLLLALVGFVLGALRKVDWAQLDATFFTTRFEVYLPAIAFGMFTGLGALGLIALREHFWRPSHDRTPRWLRLVLWLLFLALMLEGLMLSYSRGSWISFAVAGIFLIYLEWRDLRRSATPRSIHGGARIAAAIVVAIALVLPITLQHRQIAQRMHVGNETLSRVLSGDFAGVPSDTNGLRVHALRFAFERWSQRPWLGWGAGSSRYLLAHSGRRELMMNEDVWLPHLHNTYAEILIQLGIVGFSLLAALLWLLVRAGAAACRKGQMPGDLCRFFAASLLFVLIWNLGDYRFVRHDYYFFWIIFAGAAYSFRLGLLLEEDQRRPSAVSPGNGR
jgi:O-antigen ligase